MIFIFKIEFPSFLEGTLNLFFSLSPDLTKAFSFDCFIASMNLNIRATYFRLILSLILPILVFLFL